MNAIRTIAIIAAALILQACGTIQQLDTAALQATSGASYGTTTTAAASRPTARTGTPSAPSRSNSR